MKLKELLEASRMLPEYTPVKPPKGTVKLNANENLFLDESLMQDALEEACAATDPRLYPDSEGDLIKALAELHGVKPGNILVASGGDQVIDIVVGGVLGEEFLVGHGQAPRGWDGGRFPAPTAFTCRAEPRPLP